MKRQFSKKYQKKAKILCKNSEILGTFRTKVEAQTWFEQNIGAIPDKRKNCFIYGGVLYRILYTHVSNVKNDVF